jgi:ATP-dependent Lhr-like helicase
MPRGRAPRSSLEAFHPVVRTWFEATFGVPTHAQALAWGAIADGRSTLVLAPTGSGKTLAAFLHAIDRLAFGAEPPTKRRCRVLYVSPLKALAVDVERNLRGPIAGIRAAAERDGVAFLEPRVGVRSGDTDAKTRARMTREPPDVLITTPESLYLIASSAARAMLASVDAVIVDEIHALVPTKRGAHLALSLERLEELRREARPDAPALQRIGLSATARPVDEVARFLGGYDDDGRARAVEIVDATAKKAFDIRVEVTVDDMSRIETAEAEVAAPGTPTDTAAGARRSLWPSIHPRLLELIEAHRSTIVFANSRRLAERLAGALNDLATERAGGATREIALAHHGSIARETRLAIEERLKRGDLPAIVATSSLELGIDMGAVDLVIQLEPPPSIASGLQRIGRASHSVRGRSTGVVFPKHRGDLLPCAAVVAEMEAGAVEEQRYPRSALDVLAQQIVAIVASVPSKVHPEATLGVDRLYAIVRRAAPYAELPRGAFEGVLDVLSGRYPSEEFAELRARVTWDRVGSTLRPREGALRLAVVNAGTIADRGLYGVYLPSAGEDGRSRRVGELDEEMVHESRAGEVFMLGASSWRIEEITRDRVYVSPAPGEPGKMPFWHGDRPGRPLGLGRAIGAMARELSAMSEPDALERLERDARFDLRAANNLVAYLREQREAGSVVPTDETIVVERSLDELGDVRVCVLTPFGARVHAPWAAAVVAELQAQTGGAIDSLYSDDGMVFRVPASDRPLETTLFFPPSSEIEARVSEAVAATSLFAARFREAAGRALLLPRRLPGKRTPLWMQRKRAHDLLAVAMRHRSFPILLETYRECLRDAYDLPALVGLLRAIEQRRVKVETIDLAAPSPFAASILFSWVASFLYDGDAPVAERRAMALAVDPGQLRELLGEAELRELLDPEVIEEHTRMLQRLDGKRPAKSADGVHDLLLSLGDLSEDEISARSVGGLYVPPIVKQLAHDGRVFVAKLGDTKRVIAIEDAARYRDALGLALPAGLPAALLEPASDALADLVARYARTHGPFVARTLAERLGLAPSALRPAIEGLVRARRLLEGEFLRGGEGRELCDAEVLVALRRRSLARARRAVAPVDPAALGRFLPEWQGIRRSTRASRHAPHGRAGRDLLGAIELLQGAAIPASVLEREVLPRRVAGYRPSDLDALIASGEVVWAGLEPIGAPLSGGGRIALYLAEHEPLLAVPPRADAFGPDSIEARVRALLAARGALFFSEIARALGGFPGEILSAIWSLVWAGEVSNDTLSPLRSLQTASSADAQRRHGRARTLALPRTAGPPGSEGRWGLRRARWASAPTKTEVAAAVARVLLERFGILARESIDAEILPVEWSDLYKVLRAMEEAGRVRRGWFVAGRTASQFAAPGADDRLRALRDAGDARDARGTGEARDDTPPEALVLAATDPANPWGAALAWPDGAGPRPQRAAGALVFLHEGLLVGWLGRTERSLLTFLPAEEPARGRAMEALARALDELVDHGGHGEREEREEHEDGDDHDGSGGRRALMLETIDGAPAEASALAPVLRAHGFVARVAGLQRRRGDVAPARPRASRLRS